MFTLPCFKCFFLSPNFHSPRKTFHRSLFSTRAFKILAVCLEKLKVYESMNNEYCMMCWIGFHVQRLIYRGQLILRLSYKCEKRHLLLFNVSYYMSGWRLDLNHLQTARTTATLTPERSGQMDHLSLHVIENLHFKRTAGSTAIPRTTVRIYERVKMTGCWLRSLIWKVKCLYINAPL